MSNLNPFDTSQKSMQSYRSEQNSVRKADGGTHESQFQQIELELGGAASLSPDPKGSYNRQNNIKDENLESEET